jgi:hypothetical protein
MCQSNIFRNVLWLLQNFEVRSRNNCNYWYVISRQRNGNQCVSVMPVSPAIVSKGFLCSTIRRKTNDSSDPGMTNDFHWSIGWTTSNTPHETLQTTFPSWNVTLTSRGLPRNVSRCESLNLFYCIGDNLRKRTKRSMSTDRQNGTV